MARTRVAIRGGEELKRALAKLEKGLRDEKLTEATQAGVDVLAEEWRRRVPIEDRNYQEAIEAKTRPGRKGATGVVQIGTVRGLPRDEQPRRYAPKLEFGSAHTAAQPSLRPTIDSAGQRAVDAAGDKLRQLIEEAV